MSTENKNQVNGEVEEEKKDGFFKKASTKVKGIATHKYTKIGFGTVAVLGLTALAFIVGGKLEANKIANTAVAVAEEVIEEYAAQ